MKKKKVLLVQQQLMSREKRTRRKERTNKKMKIRKRKDEHINQSIYIYIQITAKVQKKKQQIFTTTKIKKNDKNERQERHITQSYIIQKQKMYLLRSY